MPFLSCNDQPTAPEDEDDCSQLIGTCSISAEACKILCNYRENWVKVIAVWRKVATLQLSAKDAEKQFIKVGNAGVGLTEDGRKLPRIIQNIVSEVEALDSEEVGQSIALAGSSATSMRDVERAKIEIARQEHGIRLIDERLKKNGCPKCEAAGAASH